MSELTLRVGFWQALPGDEVHDGGLAGGEAEGGQGHVAVEESALVDQPQDLRAAHQLVGPVCKHDYVLRSASDF